MDWQLAIVVILIVLATAYIARLTWRAWNPRRGGCGGSCGCAAKKPADKIIPVDQLTIRKRGE